MSQDGWQSIFGVGPEVFNTCIYMQARIGGISIFVMEVVNVPGFKL
jgi:hypothetical protein